jgi:hypothetical protein
MRRPLHRLLCVRVRATPGREDGLGRANVELRRRVVVVQDEVFGHRCHLSIRTHRSHIAHRSVLSHQIQSGQASHMRSDQGPKWAVGAHPVWRGHYSNAGWLNTL